MFLRVAKDWRMLTAWMTRRILLFLSLRASMSSRADWFAPVLPEDEIKIEEDDS